MRIKSGQRHRVRRGYALVTVLVFLLLMLTMLAVSQRHLASVLRIEQARTLAESRDEGRMRVMARALELLETGKPPSDPYACAATVETSQGFESFTATFANEIDDIWIVRVEPTAPGDFPPAMPPSF